MTKFNEIRPLHSSQQSVEVLSTQLPNCIGSNLVWQERMSLSLTYGEILEAVVKGNHVIVKVSKRSRFGGGNVIEKMSLTVGTKVILQY